MSDPKTQERSPLLNPEHATVPPAAVNVKSKHLRAAVEDPRVVADIEKKAAPGFNPFGREDARGKVTPGYTAPASGTGVNPNPDA